MREKGMEISIGANIARLRQKMGITQASLAEKLYVSNKTVSKWERGMGYPEITQLPSLARLLGTTVDNLIMGDRHGIVIAGNILTDTVKQIDFYPEKGMLANVRSLSMAVGGSVPNTGIDLAKIDRSIKVSALGRIGNDERGKYVVGEMQKNGIDVSNVITSSTSPTSSSDVMQITSTGERTFFHHRGANAEFCPEDVKLSALNCKMMHIAYILLLDRFDEADEEYGTAMARFLKSVQEEGIETSIDVVSDSSGLFAEKVIPALHYTDYAFMNEIEGSGVSGIPVRDADGNLQADNIRKTMEIILSKGVRRKVIMHCPEAGFCLDADGTFAVVPSIKLEKGFIKGTVGAGDAFCAGCLYGIYNGLDSRAMLEFASGAACCNLMAEDSVSGMRDKNFIFDFIAKHERLTI
ncbi:MAG: helix-turn-helix domain-containing protein [Clostridia bacterium]|nr:helix-turn-helix domain-containing protein [Clostridia bacterium]